MCIIKISEKIEENKIIKSVNFNGKNLYFEFPISEQCNLTDRLDPFIYALIFPMMEIGGEFKFEGNVSKSVLDNIEMFCKIWQIWCPDIYKPIQIIANEIADDYRPDNKKMISAFSGGLDAAYTAYKYKKQLAGRNNGDLEKSIMIHGADIPLKEEKQFDLAYKQAKIMTDDLGIKLIPVKTNFREFIYSNWEHCFGSFMVAGLNFFSKEFSIGIASDSSIKTYITHWGMNPITDPFLSNNNFKFIPDGYEHNRTQRAALIKDWKVGTDNLRVCWRNEDKSKNCGYCEKCVRTKLNMLVNGVQSMASMPFQFTQADLDNLSNIHGIHLDLIKEVYDYAIENNFEDKEFLVTLKSYIDKWEYELNKPEYQEEIQSQNIPEVQANIDNLNMKFEYLLLYLKRQKIYGQYYRYKILSKILFGKKRKHYKEKTKIYHEKVRQIRNIDRILF